MFFGLFSIAIAGSLFLARSQSAQDTESPKGTGRFSKPDRITEAIRDVNNDFVSISVRNEADRAAAKASGTVIADYGREIVVARRTDSTDSITGLDERALDTRINLPGKRFEPSELTATKESTAVSTGKDYYIVQFGAHVTDEWLGAVRELGAEIIQYVPNQAFIVYADAAAAQSLSGHSRVRWTGLYLPEHKISDLGRGRAESLGAAQTEFNVAVFKRSDLSAVHSKISSIPGLEILEVQEPGFGFIDLFTVRVSGDAVDLLAGINDVFRIDPYEEPVAEDERAAQIVAGNYTSTTTIAGPGYDPLTQFGVDGTGVTVSISDDGVGIPGNGGFYITPANAVDGPLRGATAGAEGGHGHINASIVAGSSPFGGLDPTNYNYGRGVAPGAHIINIPFLKTGNTTTDAQSVDDTVNTAGPNGVKGSIINNSWGAGTNGNTYDSFAALWDGFVFDASFAGTADPITVVFSAGNSGVSGLTRPKMAKNVITVANSENLRTELGGSNADNIDDMRSSSSRGPAADGRIKPDITAPGTYIAGSRSGGLGGVWGAIDANHVYSGGTSHSAPQIAGVAALFTQFWKTNNGGQNPSPSLVKAAILNSGLEMTGFGSNTPLPNGDEGWGRVNMKLIFDSETTTIFQNETTQMFEPGFANVLEGTVANSSKPVRIALVWTDPPGSTDPALVNDLDLTVTVGGNVYKGNVFNTGTSETGGTADNRNNVEMVRLPAGISAGTPVSIEIKSIALNGDGIPGNGDPTDQTFSLVAYNVGDQAAASPAVFDFDGDGSTDVSVFRPNAGALSGSPGPEGSTAQWWLLRSSDSGTKGLAFGTSTDVPVAADFTGDGKTDVAFWRPSTGEWFILRSEDDSFFAFPFGSNGDIPAPGDFDGDGKADPAVYRPSSGTWFIVRSSDGGLSVVPFGISADQPIVADYDGDGKDDVGVYRAPDNQFWLLRSTDSVKAFQFGAPGDRTAVGDWTGDGKADVAFFRPSTSEWYVIRSEDDSFFAFPWGATGDIPSPGDFDGDGKFDPAVWRPSDRTWYIFGTTNGFEAVQFGAAGDVPLPNSVSVN
ncbi:MAG: S8 family serine peptidase [Aridibacter famidurans]|nr:S8 family serine peptidase [Aridibacter famidurans]